MKTRRRIDSREHELFTKLIVEQTQADPILCPMLQGTVTAKLAKINIPLTVALLKDERKNYAQAI